MINRCVGVVRVFMNLAYSRGKFCNLASAGPTFLIAALLFLAAVPAYSAMRYGTVRNDLPVDAMVKFGNDGFSVGGGDAGTTASIGFYQTVNHTSDKQMVFVLALTSALLRLEAMQPTVGMGTTA